MGSGASRGRLSGSAAADSTPKPFVQGTSTTGGSVSGAAAKGPFSPSSAYRHQRKSISSSPSASSNPSHASHHTGQTSGNNQSYNIAQAAAAGIAE